MSSGLKSLLLSNNRFSCDTESLDQDDSLGEAGEVLDPTVMRLQSIGALLVQAQLWAVNDFVVYADKNLYEHNLVFVWPGNQPHVSVCL